MIVERSKPVATKPRRRFAKSLVFLIQSHDFPERLSREMRIRRDHRRLVSVADRFPLQQDTETPQSDLDGERNQPLFLTESYMGDPRGDEPDQMDRQPTIQVMLAQTPSWSAQSSEPHNE